MNMSPTPLTTEEASQYDSLATRSEYDAKFAQAGLSKQQVEEKNDREMNVVLCTIENAQCLLATEFLTDC